MTRDPSLSLIVLAAGIGSRFGGLKQAEPIGPSGELIIDYSIYDALKAGFNHVVLVVREDLRDAFADRFDRVLNGRCTVDYAIQRMEDLPEGFELPQGREKPWGTGQAVLACRDAVSGAFAVINGDDFYGSGSYELLAHHLSEHNHSKTNAGTVIGFALHDTLSIHGAVSRGICQVGEDGWLDEIQERKRVKLVGNAAVYLDMQKRWRPLSEDAVASMNMWGLPATFMDEVGRRFPQFLCDHADELRSAEFLLPEIVGNALAEGCLRVKVAQSPEAWFGVTHREDLGTVRTAIRALIEASIYPKNLWG